MFEKTIQDRKLIEVYIEFFFFGEQNTKSLRVRFKKKKRKRQKTEREKNTKV